MGNIEINYFNRLIDIINKGKLYKGNKIIQLDVLNIICVDARGLDLLNNYIQNKNYNFIVNYEQSTENVFAFIDIVLIKDANSQFYFACFEELIELFADKLLYTIYKIDECEYNDLINSKNHKGRLLVT